MHYETRFVERESEEKFMKCRVLNEKKHWTGSTEFRNTLAIYKERQKQQHIKKKKKQQKNNNVFVLRDCCLLYC